MEMLRFRTRIQATPKGAPPAMIVSSCCRLAIAGLALLHCSGFALAGDAGGSDDGSAKTASTLPNIYLDLRTNYATVPANSLSIGFSSPSISTAIATLQSLSALTNAANLPTSPTPSSPSSQGIGVDVPLTVDVTDRISIYGGFSASASQSGTSDWSAFAISSWNFGFQADIYQQNGGSIPTMTLQMTVTRAVPDSPLATTSLNNIVEFDYALNQDETRGLLAGVQYTRIDVDSPLARINPNTIGYVGGYYQWPDNWKFTGRVVVQSFGGAQLLNLTPIGPFTQPIVRFDLDRMDDNDNRLFGVTAEISWVPKPAYQLTIRTPLYAVRN
jgi:opacity protein-like surface antigen